MTLSAAVPVSCKLMVVMFGSKDTLSAQQTDDIFQRLDVETPFLSEFQVFFELSCIFRQQHRLNTEFGKHFIRVGESSFA